MRAAPDLRGQPPNLTLSAAAGTVHSFNDRSHRCTARAQRALSLRLGPQIQTLLSRERRPRGSGRTGKSRSRSSGSIVRRRGCDAHAGAKATNGPALEGDLYSWLRSALADATQGRWQLKRQAKPESSGSVLSYKCPAIPAGMSRTGRVLRLTHESATPRQCSGCPERESKGNHGACYADLAGR
jgi:hypothetical protein